MLPEYSIDEFTYLGPMEDYSLLPFVTIVDRRAEKLLKWPAFWSTKWLNKQIVKKPSHVNTQPDFPGDEEETRKNQLDNG